MLHSILGIIISVCGGIGTIFVIFYFYNVIFLVIAVLGKSKKAPDTDVINDYGYIICARNESAVIGDLIKSIKGQNYPQDKMHVFVIADNCTDDTALVAKDAGAEVVYERQNKELVGKGYALQTIVDNLLNDGRYDNLKGFFVFDADNVLDKNYTLEMNKEIVTGKRVVGAYRNVKNWDYNVHTACAGMYFIRDNFQFNRPRKIINSPAFIAGTGFFVDRSLLAEEGGWNYTLLSEDMEFTAEQILKNEPIGFCESAVFYDEQVTLFKQSWKQRTRWIRGSTDVFNKYCLTLIKRFFKKPSLAMLDIFCMMLGAGYIAAAGLITATVSMLAVMLYTGTFIGAVIAFFSYIFSFYFGLFCYSSIAILFAWKKVYLPTSKKILYLFCFPFYMMTFMIIAPFALLKRKVGWDPILHTAKAGNYVHK